MKPNYQRLLDQKSYYTAIGPGFFSTKTWGILKLNFFLWLFFDEVYFLTKPQAHFLQKQSRSVEADADEWRLVWWKSDPHLGSWGILLLMKSWEFKVPPQCQLPQEISPQFWPYQGKPMVNSPLIRLALGGGYLKFPWWRSPGYVYKDLSSRTQDNVFLELLNWITFELSIRFFEKYEECSRFSER